MSTKDRDQVGRREFLRSAAIGAGLAASGGIAEVLASPLVRGDVGPASLVTQARPFDILVIGDSIMWGQGHKEEQKFSSRVERWVRTNLADVEVRRHVLAHSGARIKPNASEDAKPPTHGEVPNHFPSVTAQLERAPGMTSLQRDNVALVLMDGGINDVGTKVILNLDPTVGRSWIRKLTRERCVDRMRGLLPQVAGAFPNAKVVVTNYFQIVSEKSNMVLVWELLKFWDVVGGAVDFASGPLRTKLSDQSLAFHQASTEGFREVVAEVGRQLVATTGKRSPPTRVSTSVEAMQRPVGRVALAEIPFGPQHAYGASQTLLFHVNEPDPAASVRKPACVSQVPNASPDFPNCLLAAGGHPNVQGVSVYANAIIGVLEQWLPEWQATYGRPAGKPDVRTQGSDLRLRP